MRLNKLLPLCFLAGCTTDTIDHRAGGITGRPTNPGEIGTLAVALNHPLSLAVDDTGIYVTTGWPQNCADDCPFLDGQLEKVDFNGSTSTLLFAGEQLLQPVIDGANIYFPSRESGSVYSMPKAGGAPNTLVSGLRQPMLLAVDGSELTWINCGWCGFSWDPTGQIARMSVTSTAPTIRHITPGFIGGMAIAGNETIITRAIFDQNNDPIAIELLAVDNTTGVERIIDADLEGAGQVLFDGTDIFYIDGETVRGLPFAGGPGISTLVLNIEAMTQDATHIYFTTGRGVQGTNGAIRRIDKATFTLEVVAVTEFDPGAIAVDDNYIYWLEPGIFNAVEGRVRAILKP